MVIPLAIIPVTPNHLTAAQILQAYPILQRIAGCESGGGDPNLPARQFNGNGSPLWGNDPKIKGATTTDVGMSQIPLKYHGNEVKKLGLDVVHSADDNANFALMLL